MGAGEDGRQCLEEIGVGTRRRNGRFEVLFLLDHTADAGKRRLEQVGREGGRLGSLERRQHRFVGCGHRVDRERVTPLTERGTGFTLPNDDSGVCAATTVRMWQAGPRES